MYKDHGRHRTLEGIPAWAWVFAAASIVFGLLGLDAFAKCTLIERKKPEEIAKIIEEHNLPDREASSDNPQYTGGANSLRRHLTGGFRIKAFHLVRSRTHFPLTTGSAEVALTLKDGRRVNTRMTFIGLYCSGVNLLDENGKIVWPQPSTGSPSKGSGRSSDRGTPSGVPDLP